MEKILKYFNMKSLLNFWNLSQISWYCSNIFKFCGILKNITILLDVKWFIKIAILERIGGCLKKLETKKQGACL